MKLSTFSLIGLFTVLSIIHVNAADYHCPAPKDIRLTLDGHISFVATSRAAGEHSMVRFFSTVPVSKVGASPQEKINASTHEKVLISFTGKEGPVMHCYYKMPKSSLLSSIELVSETDYNKLPNKNCTIKGGEVDKVNNTTSKLCTSSEDCTVTCN